MPKWPCSSGPVRKELGRCTLILRETPLRYRHPEARLEGCGRGARAISLRGSLRSHLRVTDLRSNTVRYLTEVLRGFPRSVNERADFIGILLSRRAFDAGRNIDGRRARN